MNPNDTYLQDLNPSQRQAVECTQGAMLVIAGAGSGKTRVLTYRVAHLLHQGVPPYQIMALTFTNKAAREMQSRIATLVDPQLAAQLWMGTFHSIFCRILRRESALVGFSPRFTIYDAADTKALVTAIIKEMGLDDKVYKPSHVCARISRAKNALAKPAEYAASAQWAGQDRTDNLPAIHQVYTLYAQRCRQADVMDFDDILLFTHQLLSQHPQVAEQYAKRFQYLLVDEYQDTNYAQDRIVYLLAQHHGNVCAVGDDAQSIYSFRGAEIGNILLFEKQYPGARLVKLEQNYRSTQTIVGAANSLIRRNRNQIHKEVFSQNPQGSLIEVHTAGSDREEAFWAAMRLSRLAADEHIPYGQMAILYRTNAQSRSLEEAFRLSGIPYKVYGGLAFYQRKEVKDALAYCRLAVNPHDEVALKRVINYPARGIGQTTLARLSTYAQTEGISMWQALGQSGQIGVNRGTEAKLVAFRRLITDFAQMTEEMNAHELGLKIVRESGMEQDVSKSTAAEDRARMENLQELVDGMGQFCRDAQAEGETCTMADYLQTVSLMSDTEEDEGDAASTPDVVSLMTIHAAKGLEFDAVIVVGLEDDLFPSSMCKDHPHQMEEERRLCYVAITRARRFLAFTHCYTRFRYGSIVSCQPSPFLKEIDPTFFSGYSKPASSQPKKWLTRNESQPSRWSTPHPPTPDDPLRKLRAIKQCPPTPDDPLRKLRAIKQCQPTPTAHETPAVQPGMYVRHARFGQGQVLAVKDTGVDAKATIKFDDLGEKKIFLRFTKLEIVSKPSPPQGPTHD